MISLIVSGVIGSVSIVLSDWNCDDKLKHKRTAIIDNWTSLYRDMMPLQSLNNSNVLFSQLNINAEE